MARTVLLADDSVTAQNMGRRILMDAGYEVITVNNGSAALKKIHESQPDLIVLDVYMPGYGGLEVCQRLKESGETMRIPVLLTVGKMEPFKSDEAKRVRADGHIVKPFEASELLAALAKLEDRIVPRGEASRGRKKKSEKARFWHAADPATTFDDSQTDSIAYLSEVKQRQSHGDASDSAPVEEAVEASAAPVTQDPVISAPVEQTAPEMPVIAESVPVLSQESVVPEEPASPEPQSLVEEHPAPEVSTPASAAPEAEISQTAATPQATAEMSSDSASAAVQHTAQSAPLVTSVPRWIAESIALSSEEASIALEDEMLQAQARSAAASAPSSAPGGEPLPGISAPVESAPVTPEEKTGATFAAAASASSGPVSHSSIASRAASEGDSETATASEAAAAWQNWQQIRDSVMSAQTTEVVAQSVAAVAGASKPAAGDETAQATSDPSLEGAALASIVDSVLAELKPKLMEEIAKKLKK